MLNKRQFEAKRSEREEELHARLDKVYADIETLQKLADSLQLELALVENLTYEDDIYARKER